MRDADHTVQLQYVAGTRLLPLPWTTPDRSGLLAACRGCLLDTVHSALQACPVLAYVWSAAVSSGE